MGFTENIMGRFIDLTGQAFGSLTVLERDPAAARSDGVLWRCRCSCGKETAGSSGNLRRGQHRSCGCATRRASRRDVMGEPEHLGPTMLRPKLDAGRSGRKSNSYTSWRAMWDRCTKRSNKDWHLYGERGVTVCSEWTSFATFCEDMGPRPRGTSLERIDSDDHYEPGNCVWATAKTQARNKRSNFNVTWQGETMCLKDWAERLGIKHTTLHRRVRDYGWSIDRAFTEPVERRKRE
jgi:hypothetical protein